MAQNGTRATGPRCIALVGPFQSGKTTLLEAILARTGAIQRQGTVDAGTTVGDASKEARHHRMSVELSVATTSFMGESYTFVDCPGSVEFIHDMRAALPAVDAAVVVCEMDEKKIPQLQLILRELEDQKIPRFLFLNKIDKADSTIHDVLALLQPASRSQAAAAADPDLQRRHRHRLRRSRARARLCLQGARRLRGRAARRRRARSREDRALLHAGDARRPRRRADGAVARRHRAAEATRCSTISSKELRDGLVCPVLMGSATRTNGVLRLMKALRHEAPDIADDRQAARRQGRQRSGRLCAQDAAHRARRQDVDRARAQRPGRRRHDLHDARARGRPRRRRVQAHGPDHREARAGAASARPSRSASSTMP